MKKIFPLISLSIGTMMLSGCIIVNAKSIAQESNEHLSLNAKNISELKIEAGAGFIVVNGDDTIENIEVDADIRSFNKNYRLSLVEKNGKAVLIADLSPKDSVKWFVLNSNNGDSAKIDLTIRMPKSMQLSIDDGSGNINVSDVNAKVSVHDGSGNINLNHIQGGVDIEDGSGEIDLADINQAININDGSGDIIIHNAASKVTIEDGSGEIELFDIAGEIEIDDGSGDLLVKSAKGHVTINDGSGDIKVTELESGLTITNAGSGGLSMSKVKGEVITH